MTEPGFDFEQWVVDQLSSVGYTASTWFPGTEPALDDVDAAGVSVLKQGQP